MELPDDTHFCENSKSVEMLPVEACSCFTVYQAQIVITRRMKSSKPNTGGYDFEEVCRTGPLAEDTMLEPFLEQLKRRFHIEFDH